MYAAYLVASGYRVVEACDGQEAVTRARELLPDVVVMDLSLPVMDGWAATRVLKGDTRTRGIPIIALTGRASAAHFRDAREAGCDGFILKPCLPAVLLASIRHAIPRRTFGERSP